MKKSDSSISKKKKGKKSPIGFWKTALRGNFFLSVFMEILGELIALVLWTRCRTVWRHEHRDILDVDCWHSPVRHPQCLNWWFSEFASLDSSTRKHKWVFVACQSSLFGNLCFHVPQDDVLSELFPYCPESLSSWVPHRRVLVVLMNQHTSCWHLGQLQSCVQCRTMWIATIINPLILQVFPVECFWKLCWNGSTQVYFLTSVVCCLILNCQTSISSADLRLLHSSIKV